MTHLTEHFRIPSYNLKIIDNIYEYLKFYFSIDILD